VSSAESEKTPVAIVGASGALGFGLAVRLGHAGVPVVIGSREQTRALQAVRRAQEIVPDGLFSGAQNAQAATDARMLILSVPFANQSETLASLKSVLQPGQLVIDASVPLAATLSGKATRMLGIWQGSAAQQAQELLPEGVRVVSALHTVSAASLSDLDHELAEDVLICGDDRADKQAAALLIERIAGLRCVDCGPLEMARITESLTALLISVNVRYKTHAGVRLTGLPDATWR
jgi:8-hydroxy-5-deazaflavin:NADPH oxidoreductase